MLFKNCWIFEMHTFEIPASLNRTVNLIAFKMNHSKIFLIINDCNCLCLSKPFHLSFHMSLLQILEDQVLINTPRRKLFLIFTHLELYIGITLDTWLATESQNHLGIFPSWKGHHSLGNIQDN